MTKYVATKGNHKTYHTDTDCQYLNDTNYREAMPGEIETHGLEKCKRCNGEYDTTGGNGSAYTVEDFIDE